MIRSYTIIIGLLQSFLWIAVRRAGLETYAYILEKQGNSLSLPPLSKLSFLCTPYAWIIPFALIAAVVILWKKDEKWTMHALGAATVTFLAYLALCAIGFAMPLIPIMSKFIP